jgi:coenzyme F420 hydrogenase subunit beta
LDFTKRRKTIFYNINILNMTENFRKVIGGDYCVGCGACAFVSDSKMNLNKYGEYIPEATDINNSEVEAACPFLKPELNEDVLAEEFLDGKDNHNPGIGFHDVVYGGYVKEKNFRENGTSGGMGTWIGSELLKNGLIDGIIHVKPYERENALDPFYQYAISRTIKEISVGAKSKYHVVEISEVMREVKNSPGRYLFIGVPCLVKSVRRLQRLDPIIKERIAFTASLVCGHFKSVNWTVSLGWGAGLYPNELKAFQYRTKGEGIPARKYVFKATPKDSSQAIVQKDSANVVGGKFNQGAMMLPACNFCDDVVGETADLTIGDAWLPQFEADDNGTNLLIVRNKEIGQLLVDAFEDNRVYLKILTAEDAVKSQSGGFRQRREGLSYRLEQKEKKNLWYPKKRVSPGEFSVSAIRKMVYQQRLEVSELSRTTFVEAVEKNDYKIYANKLEKKLKKLRKIEVASTFFRSAYTHLKIKILKKIA